MGGKLPLIYSEFDFASVINDIFSDFKSIKQTRQ